MNEGRYSTLIPRGRARERIVMHARTQAPPAKSTGVRVISSRLFVDPHGQFAVDLLVYLVLHLETAADPEEHLRAV